MDEKQQFSQRLKAAMAAAGLEVKPAVLERLFNLHYQGRPVSYQGVRYWMIGLSIPEQDKLETLADLLSVDAQELRYGRRAGRKPASEARWPVVSNVSDRIVIDTYLRLPDDQRRAVGEIIQSLTRMATGKV